ncbi:MAG: branched-chain amino acid ABC transporter permease [Chloroflexi bacterium]|nr:branched-chain amino acid ABC transporter permease [Chloroflexota bacterium]
MTLEAIVAIIASGLVSGSLYALMASGLSLVWGTVRMFNFAHGALVMIGAYSGWYISNRGGLAKVLQPLGKNITTNSEEWGLLGDILHPLGEWILSIKGGFGLLLGVPLAIIFCGLAGYVIYVLLVKPFVGKPGADLVVIITTIAGASFLQNGVQVVFGPRYKQLDRILKGPPLEVLDTAIGLQEVLIIVLTPVTLLLLNLFLKRSKLGLAIRAVAQNDDFARLVGINVNQIYPLTFVVSSMLAGLAGLMLGGLFFILPTMGSEPLLRAFVVVVFGGLGSLPGTIIGAYVIGLIEQSSAYVFSLYWAPVVLFATLILVLIFRPRGLMGGENS